MAELRQSVTPRPSRRRSHTPDENANVLPTPAASSQESTGKPKQHPTITPRRFKRFFTPRSSLKRHVKLDRSRQVLRDITGGDSNRTSVASRQFISKDYIQVFEDQGEVPVYTSRKRRRTLPISPEPTPDNSSPLKRVRCYHPFDQEVSGSDCETDRDIEIPDTKHSGETGWHDESGLVKKPIVRWKQDSLSANNLRRGYEACGYDYRRTRYAVSGFEWQSQTTNFSTGPSDMHSCTNVCPTYPQYAIPFCTASCNTNSLVAIGDEEGGIRLLDADKRSKTAFSKPYLTFRPHGNAVLDLSFSHDDLLLATASGDQTSRVIDMPTQTAVCGMAEHSSSVKQVCFQPGSSNIIVTSSRDGSVLMWDLRCKGYHNPVREVQISLSAHEDNDTNNSGQRSVPFARSINQIHEAHAASAQSSLSAAAKIERITKTAHNRDSPSGIEPQNRRGEVSITSLTFLGAGREHLLLTGSEANASVKVWDLRTTHNHRRSRTMPLSSTRLPDSHNTYRHFGLTSIALSGDGARLYTTCRDNTIYAYSTSHLILGHAPELSLGSRPRRAGRDIKEGLGPLYGFRHPQYHATTFYVKSALRPAAGDHSELLAVGSSDGCAIVFPTDERYLTHDASSKPQFNRTDSGTSLFSRMNDTIPMYHKGTALIRGHNREVTDMTWTPNGELITVGDDLTARCWREGPDARDLRTGGESGGKRWECGWAEAEAGWDDDV